MTSSCCGWATERARWTRIVSLCWHSPLEAACWPSPRPGKTRQVTLGQSSSHWNAPQTEVFKQTCSSLQTNHKSSLAFSHSYSFILSTPRSYLVSYSLHSEWWQSGGWLEPRLGRSGWANELCDADLLSVLPPIPVQHLQHHVSGESGWRRDLEHSSQSLCPARGEELRPRTGIRHSG